MRRSIDDVVRERLSSRLIVEMDGDSEWADEVVADIIAICEPLYMAQGAALALAELYEDFTSSIHSLGESVRQSLKDHAPEVLPDLEEGPS